MSGLSAGTWRSKSDDVPVFGGVERPFEAERRVYLILGAQASSIPFMLGKDLSGMSFPESGFNGAWHGSSHHGDKPDNVANYAKKDPLSPQLVTALDGFVTK